MAVVVFDVGHLMPVIGGDLEADDALPRFRPGQVSKLLHQAGPVYAQYCQNRSGSALTQGQLVSKYGDLNGLTAITNLDSGSTVLATKTSGFTANKHAGAICYVLDKASSAGAAPESEASPILSNTADALTLDPDFPLSTSLLVNDDLIILSTYQGDAAAASDINTTVLGVVLAAGGISDGQFGWVAFFGIVRALVKASTGLVTGQQLIADTARVNPAAASSTFREIIGKAMATLTSDVVLDMGLVHLACASNSAGFSDQDAVA